jgi:hypothetical protein
LPTLSAAFRLAPAAAHCGALCPLADNTAKKQPACSRLPQESSFYWKRKQPANSQPCAKLEPTIFF